MNNTTSRVFEYLNNGQWNKCALEELEVGDTFRMWERSTVTGSLTASSQLLIRDKVGKSEFKMLSVPEFDCEGLR